jgi:hypothetical protein
MPRRHLPKWRPDPLLEPELRDAIHAIAKAEKRKPNNTIEWLLTTHPRVAPLLPKGDEAHD